MIAEIVPEAYDAIGRQVSQPFSRRKSPHPTFPIGRYLSQPLSMQCRTIADLRRFLLTCNYVSDEELFGKPDYWQPPEDFEKRRKGDCEDFALWAWRQLLNMGYDARFVGGPPVDTARATPGSNTVRMGNGFLSNPSSAGPDTPCLVYPPCTIGLGTRSHGTGRRSGISRTKNPHLQFAG